MANRRSEVSASGNLPRVEYEDIVSGTGTLNKDVFEKQSQKQGIVFHSGDVLYGKLRPYLQNWLLASFNGLAVGDFWVLEPQGLNSNYLYRIIQTKQFDEIANQSVGTKMPRADWKLVSKATFLNPASFNEQRLIGKFFKDIDSLLTLHQRQSENTERRSDFCVRQGHSGALRRGRSDRRRAWRRSSWLERCHGLRRERPYRGPRGEPVITATI